MKLILRSGAVTAAVGVGLSVAVLPITPASAAGGTHVRCNDITGLKRAINQANTSGGRITLAPRCTYTLTAPDSGDDGLPQITGNVTVSGRDTTVRRSPDATQDFRIFHVANGGELTLKSLTVSGGQVTSALGGGIRNDNGGTLNLYRSAVKNNRASSGAGIYSLGGQINLSRSAVERNTASGFGGGIVNDGNGTMTMRGGSLHSNRALTSNGGGLENIVGTASLESASVRGNTAVEGGGIRNVNGSTVRLKSTTLRENIATRGAGLSNLSSTATLVRSLVTRNTAITAGGGIYNEGTLPVTLTDTKVVRNAPDNCAPAGSVPGCTNSAGTVIPPSSQLPPAGDIRPGK